MGCSGAGDGDFFGADLFDSEGRFATSDDFREGFFTGATVGVSTFIDRKGVSESATDDAMEAGIGT